MDSHQKEAWHHQSIMWWHADDVRVFGWWHLHQYWRDIKGRIHRRERVPSFDFTEQRSIPQGYLGVSQQWACQEFLWKEKIMCLVTVSLQSCGFKQSDFLQFFISFFAWVAIKVVCPVHKDRSTKQQASPVLSVHAENCRYGLRSSQSIGNSDSFVAFLGGFKKSQHVSGTLLA